MDFEVRWSEEAVESFTQVIAYLQKDWSEKEIRNFAESTDRVIEYISLYPKMFRKTNKRNIREALVTPHNLLIYKIYPSHITLLRFWDTRLHPKKK